MSIDGSFVIRFITYSRRLLRTWTEHRTSVTWNRTTMDFRRRRSSEILTFFSYITTTCRERDGLLHTRSLVPYTCSRSGIGSSSCIVKSSAD